MTINLYSNLSDSRYVAKQLTEIGTREILLLDDDNITNPVITLNLFENYSVPNYCYIANFGRYYYITSAEILTGNRVRYSLKCDVLMSFANEIKSTAAILSRSNSMGNILINDSQQAVRADDILTNLAFSGCEFLKNGIGAANYSFVLNTFGGENSGN